jgi:Lrp/AsnC family transcriptional regulator, leucine-responsive regulatory protein
MFDERHSVDTIDRTLLGLMQEDATRTYVELGEAVHLSAPAAHERVRKLRESGVIQRTTIDVDPEAVGKGMLVFALVDSSEWMGDAGTATSFLAIDGVEAAYAVAGKACVLAKIRTRTPSELQDVLREIYAIDGARGTESIVVLETLFERPMSVHPATK